jgi:hypothetical protein
MTGGCSGRELDEMLQGVMTGVYGDFKGNGKLWQRTFSERPSLMSIVRI